MHQHRVGRQLVQHRFRVQEIKHIGQGDIGGAHFVHAAGRGCPPVVDEERRLPAVVVGFQDEPRVIPHIQLVRVQSLLNGARDNGALATIGTTCTMEEKFR